MGKGIILLVFLILCCNVAFASYDFMETGFFDIDEYEDEEPKEEITLDFYDTTPAIIEEGGGGGDGVLPLKEESKPIPITPRHESNVSDPFALLMGEEGPSSFNMVKWIMIAAAAYIGYKFFFRRRFLF